ncbi:hypothetical protein RE628_27575 [Paenibacillus sp. D2_2]|uniref:hypothetical protein n=1 Tax=Paenibacillus sp. D2_2 TaxID=3073092 RepID=UPI0028154357|nr:hypothetical protein [Paenibacillus sp. D2_2]WMT40813.1 hypothetical protein RE628_27575 [Paenibacillus sp. D2_2]
MNDIIQQINQAGLSKVNLLKQSKGKYLVSSMLAGLFVGLGIILIFTIGGLLSPLKFQVRRSSWASLLESP